MGVCSFRTEEMANRYFIVSSAGLILAILKMSWQRKLFHVKRSYEIDFPFDNKNKRKRQADQAAVAQQPAKAEEKKICQ